MPDEWSVVRRRSSLPPGSVVASFVVLSYRTMDISDISTASEDPTDYQSRTCDAGSGPRWTALSLLFSPKSPVGRSSLRDGRKLSFESFFGRGFLTGVCDRTGERKDEMLVYGRQDKSRSEGVAKSSGETGFRQLREGVSNVRHTFAGTSELEKRKKCQHFWSKRARKKNKGNGRGRSQRPVDRM